MQNQRMQLLFQWSDVVVCLGKCTDWKNVWSYDPERLLSFWKRLPILNYEAMNANTITWIWWHFR